MKEGQKAWLVRLPMELLSRWRALAKSRGISAVRLLERVMLAVLEGSDAPVGVSDQTEAASTGRLSLRLNREDLAAVKDAAKVEGHSVTGWVGMVVRARLRSDPILTRNEVEALSLATMQMQAIGRNLNSAIHRLHVEGRWYEQAAQMKDVSTMIGRVSERMNAVVDKATDRGRF
jgi:uncharacterized protein (DUF1778 family)